MGSFLHTGKAAFDWSPLKKRVPDALNGEVFQGDVVVPPGAVTDEDFARRLIEVSRQVTQRLIEADHVEKYRGLDGHGEPVRRPFRCIQIHVHFPDKGEYISHSVVHDEPDPH